MAKDMTAALQGLTEEAIGQTSRKDKTLPEGRAVNQIPERVGKADKPTSTASSGGIASPLTETLYSARLYWDSVTYQSTDGFITLQVEPIKKIRFKDANGADADFVYAQPT